MKKAILIIVSHLLLVFTQAFAQIPELTHSNVIPPSPVASELTKYITYPVDLCNGLVKTSIPLYEIVDGDIRIPITLNYHASGLKPNMRSSHWLGDGWSLSTGPSLSRTINGVADEIKYLPELALRDSLSYEQLNAIYTQAVDVRWTNSITPFREAVAGFISDGILMELSHRSRFPVMTSL